MLTRTLATAGLLVGSLLVATPVGAAPAPTAATPSVAVAAQAGHCARQGRIDVPRAPMQKADCLDDLTTAGTSTNGHTDQSDWASLNAPGTDNPTGVPGIQVDGYFPDSSTSNTRNGWNHDSQFVIRLPDKWNGKIVVSGAPGTRSQYAGDFIFSDWVLAQGYAYASTDKGNGGTSFYDDGGKPGDSIAEWNHRVTQLTRATKKVAAQRYGHAPRRTYLFGISNGGYLVRWQLENRPGLYDGGVDWEGTLYQEQSPNLLTYLPVALRNYPAYAATGDQAAHDRMIRAGFAKGSEFTWDYHYGVYWDLTQRVYREELDPSYDGDTKAGTPFCPSGTPSCDADYHYAKRPVAHRALAKVALTGDIRRPMLTVHGTIDALLPIATDSDVYDRKIKRQGRGALHRYYRIVGGTHVDGLNGEFGDRVRPILPCARAAFTRMVKWVERDVRPPASRTVPRAPEPYDETNRCSLR
ncbi:tannase/feruloyl esterase family alpha/beta hydrolase [Nocardioides sp. KIGAM211]|uniref:Tannase/feruloyl esterase family alpha/beta hydrolase n=1 Tax=Nocardioides luti TaxID=2761101 RepID=A0A7X0VC41_9ACTN|nr:tannase/feruloyl esterase family alpha/beta hydrolase [Nocardioides luti]MBB6629399.1 tannase/feruloyl esterase family alpha/beta hydrolase [Nocardioides luti]